MDQRFREPFNRAFSQELYASYQEALETATGAQFEFRLAETPIFIPPDLLGKIRNAANGIMDQLSDRSLIESMKDAIPGEWDVPAMDELPSFAQVDFAIVREDDGSLGVRLIELQGFPSLTSLQVLQRDAWQSILEPISGLGGIDWSCWFGMDRESFLSLARDVITGGNDPELVAMVDIDPPSQKTWPDFAATELLFGVEAVSITDLVVRGRQLFRRKGNSLVPVRRIYNRIVFDELIEKSVNAPFRWNEELEVSWAPHPNWYWVWSKATIPRLDHPLIPRTILVSELEGEANELDLEQWVLKPLFSFAGGGVSVGPGAGEIDRIPPDQRSNWCLQRRIEYAPVLFTPDGAGVKVEFRCMFLRRPGESKMTLAQNLCRLARGRMLGVDFNRDFDWVGGSVGLWPR